MAHTLSQDRRRQYVEQGYVHWPGVYPPEAAVLAEPAIHRALYYYEHEESTLLESLRRRHDRGAGRLRDALRRSPFAYYGAYLAGQPETTPQSTRKEAEHGVTFKL